MTQELQESHKEQIRLALIHRIQMLTDGIELRKNIPSHYGIVSKLRESLRLTNEAYDIVGKEE